MKKYLKSNRKEFIIYSIAIIITSLLTAGMGFLYSALTSTALGDDFQKFILMAIFAVIYLLFDAYFDYVPRATKSVLVNSVMNSMRMDLTTHYLKKDLYSLNQEDPSVRTNRLVNDLDVIENEYLRPILSIIQTSFLFIFSLMGAFYLQGMLTIIMLVICFVPFIAPLINQKILSSNKKDYQEAKKSYLGVFESFSRNISTVVITNSQKVFNKTLGKSSQDMKDSNDEFKKQESKTIAISYGLSNIVYSGTWIIGGIFVFNKQLTVPGLIAMTTLMNTVAGPIQYLSELVTDLSSSKEVVKDYFDTIKDDPIDRGEKNNSFSEEIIKLDLDNITYSVKGKELFDKLNCEFDKNKKYAIKGESGAGKSTLLQILMGIIRPDKGFVKVNGLNLQEVNSYDYYDHIAYVSQKTAIFPASIAENVTMFGPVDAEKVKICLEKAGLSKLISGFEAGIETKLTAETKLSGGEERRLDIARALYRDANVLIFDEPTSGLDSINENLISEAIGKIENKIIIVVTHSNSKEFLGNFDQILKLENGKLNI